MKKTNSLIFSLVAFYIISGRSAEKVIVFVFVCYSQCNSVTIPKIISTILEWVGGGGSSQTNLVFQLALSVTSPDGTL